MIISMFSGFIHTLKPFSYFANMSVTLVCKTTLILLILISLMLYNLRRKKMLAHLHKIYFKQSNGESLFKCEGNLQIRSLRVFRPRLLERGKIVYPVHTRRINFSGFVTPVDQETSLPATRPQYKM